MENGKDYSPFSIAQSAGVILSLGADSIPSLSQFVSLAASLLLILIVSESKSRVEYNS